jgi:Raf kinase inhibitor-like YbhB/YbcL family protein
MFDCISRRSVSLVGALALLLGLLLGADAGEGQGPPGAESSGPFVLRSSAFDDGDQIPSRYTCEGEDISPPLSWSRPPAGTRSLALIVDDPDAPDPKAPRMTWVHWVVYGLPPTAGELPEGVSRQALPTGAREGRNGWKRQAYGGPCPPIGRHRYFHKLYALDTVLSDLEAATKAQIEEAMKGHVIERVQLIGTYQKRNR